MRIPLRGLESFEKFMLYQQEKPETNQNQRKIEQS